MTSPHYDLAYPYAQINGERKPCISAHNLLVSLFSNRFSSSQLPECGGDVSLKKAKHNASQCWTKYSKLKGLECVHVHASVPDLGWTAASLLTSYKEVEVILSQKKDKGGSGEKSD